MRKQVGHPELLPCKQGINVHISSQPLLHNPKHSTKKNHLLCININLGKYMCFHLFMHVLSQYSNMLIYSFGLIVLKDNKRYYLKKNNIFLDFSRPVNSFHAQSRAFRSLPVPCWKSG